MAHCKICDHPDRDSIDRLLADPLGPSLRDVADKFSLKKDAVARHKSVHLTPYVSKAIETKEIARAEKLVDLIRDGRDKGQTLLDKVLSAAKSLDPTADTSKLLKIAKEVPALGRMILEYLKVEGQLTGELSGSDVLDRQVLIVVPALLPAGATVPLQMKVSDSQLLNSPGAQVPDSPEVLEAEFSDLPPEPPKPHA